MQNYQALIIGILVTLAIYLSLLNTFDVKNISVRKTIGLFSGLVGLLTYIWLQDHPDLLEKYVAEIVLAGIGVLLAMLALAKNRLNRDKKQ